MQSPSSSSWPASGAPASPGSAPAGGNIGVGTTLPCTAVGGAPPGRPTGSRRDRRNLDLTACLQRRRGRRWSARGAAAGAGLVAALTAPAPAQEQNYEDDSSAWVHSQCLRSVRRGCHPGTRPRHTRHRYPEENSPCAAAAEHSASDIISSSAPGPAGPAAAARIRICFTGPGFPSVSRTRTLRSVSPGGKAQARATIIQN